MQTRRLADSGWVGPWLVKAHFVCALLILTLTPSGCCCRPHVTEEESEAQRFYKNYRHDLRYTEGCVQVICRYFATS